MPYRTTALDLLILWREAERQHTLATNLLDAAILQAGMDELRDEYRAVREAAIVAGMPAPPEFPEAR